MEQLTAEELISLIGSVFPPHADDRQLALLVDIPRRSSDDQAAWKQRRHIVGGWYEALKNQADRMGLESISLLAYADVGSNNADLPAEAYLMTGPLPDTADQLATCGTPVTFQHVFSTHQLYLAPTQYSSTAPMKNAARDYGFRAATMPGFSPLMIPALRIDYNEVYRRVSIIKEKVDPALWADVHFKVDGSEDYHMHFDLRHRTGHLSSGRFPLQAVAGNLPSGETYIVPYEGEKGEKSETHGSLPVQLGDQLVVFTINENVAVSVTGEGEAAAAERDHLKREPAYGNMAELGFGVLGDFGLAPINEILLDEKLGFHIAFGRSDHFGGNVGPKNFSGPAAVIHLDRIYIKATQPRISVTSIQLGYDGDKTETILADDHYLVF